MLRTMFNGKGHYAALIAEREMGRGGGGLMNVLVGEGEERCIKSKQEKGTNKTLIIIIIITIIVTNQDSNLFLTITTYQQSNVIRT